MTTTRRLRLAATAVVAVLAVLPFAVAGRISLGIFVFIGLFSLIVIGLSLLAGHAGQVSLGQAAFYGLGAYIAAITTLRMGLAPGLALPLAVCGAALVAYVVGAPIFALRGHFLVLGTLGLNVVMDVLVRNLQHLTGGPTGLTGIPPLSIGALVIVGDRAYYYLIWSFVLAALWLGRNLVCSRVGRALAAVRSSEVAAAAVGINAAFYKSRVFALSGALAGLAGALYVHYLSFVSPSPFAFNFSIDLLVMSVLGGLYHLPGAGAEPASVLRLEGLRKQFGGLLAVDDLSIEVPAGEIYAIIGPNGAGKTTVFNLISGLLRPTRGAVYLRGRKVSDLPAYETAALGVGRTFQTPKVFADLTVLENVMVGLHRLTTTSFTAAMFGLGAREDAQAAARAAGYLEAVGLLDRADVLAGALPFGALRLLEVARALAIRPVLLLLDEPASGLSSAERTEVVKLIRHIRDTGTTVVLVEHDVGLVMETADRVLVLNYGQRIAEGAPRVVRNDPRVIAAYLGEEAAS